MNTRHIIFHIPMHLNRQHASASQIRPFKLIEAFLQMGYAVDVVEGKGAERKKAINNIKNQIKKGIHYDFLYSESSVMPTLLTEKHHLPIYPCLDFGLFRFCKRHHIPIGLFYRDIHWCYINKNKGWKQHVAKYFYRYDLWQYQKYLDILFLPTLRMLEHIPAQFNCPVVELPAGCEMQTCPNAEPHKLLELLYIGGIGGNYDLTTFLDAVIETPSVHLTLCCRPDDLEKVHSQYSKYLTASNITFTHQQGEQLKALYTKADLFTMLFAPTPYIRFSAPYKLFEAIGYQKPLLVYEECWSGQFVTDHHIGLACKVSKEDVILCFNKIRENPNLLAQFQQEVNRIAPLHTWHSRCRQIAETLISTQQ